MISWLWALLTFVIGEFVGLYTYALFSADKIEEEKTKKGCVKHVQKNQAER